MSSSLPVPALSSFMRLCLCSILIFGPSFFVQMLVMWWRGAAG